MPRETRYLAYLLRLWIVHHDETLVCRALLENPHTGERRAFADLEHLFNYLAREVWEVPDVTPDVTLGEGQTKAE